VKEGAPSLSHPQNCTSTEPRSKHETVSPSDAPKPLKVTIEEVEDEDEVRMRQKPKLKGPGILEEVDNDQKPVPQLASVDRNREPNQKKVPTGKTEHFLQRIRGTPQNAMEMLQ
jgi:hypothetical protein